MKGLTGRRYQAVGGADDVTIAEIIGTGATADELAEAQAWIVNDDPLLNAGKPLPSGRVRELIDILAELEPNEDETRKPFGLRLSRRGHGFTVGRSPSTFHLLASRW